MKTLYQGISDTKVAMLREYLGMDASGTHKYLFDAKVHEQLITFQILHNLTVDGIVGPKTWAALLREHRVTNKRATNSLHYFSVDSLLVDVDIDALVRVCSSIFNHKERTIRILTNTIAVIINNPKLSKISTVGELLLFLGQTREEVGSNMRLMENANYSYVGLLQVSSYYRNHTREALEDCRSYKHPANKKNILNKMYANRYGNGSISSGDGLAFSGKGLNQLTFRNNYRAVNTSLNKLGIHLDLENKPHILASPENCMYGALAYWGKLVHPKIKNKPINNKTVDIVTSIYNRYTHSYYRRWKHTLHLLNAIKKGT